jgi:hypothetical protein
VNVKSATTTFLVIVAKYIIERRMWLSDKRSMYFWHSVRRKVLDWLLPYMGYVIGFGLEQCFNGVIGSDLVKCNADGKTASTHFTKAGCTNFTTKICCCNSYGLCVYNDTKCDSGSGEKQPDNSRCDVRAGTVVPTKVPTQSGCKAVGATVTSGGDCCSKNAQYKDSQLTCVDCKGTGETVSSASQCCSKKAENGKCVDLASSYVSPTPKASDPTAKPTTNLNSCGDLIVICSKCTVSVGSLRGSSLRCVNRVNSCGQFVNDFQVQPVCVWSNTLDRLKMCDEDR